MEVIIDVRERDEYAQEHIEHSVNVPLSHFTAVAPGILNQLKDREIIFMCRSGARATHAMEQAKGLGYNDVHQYRIYEGGLVQWKKNELPVVQAGKTAMPIIRQAQISIGLMIILTAALAVSISPIFGWATLAIGAGLFYAGASGNCAIAGLLAKAPWNKASRNPTDCTPAAVESS